MMRSYFKDPVKITLSITKACNQACKLCYCDCTSAPSPDELSTVDWIRFIDYLVEHGFMQVYIEGGEPLHRPDIMDVLRYCSRKLMTLLRTNGSLIDSTRARELKAIGVGRVLVDFMGARAGTHDEHAGLPGSFERACNAVGWLVDAGIPTDVLTILNRHNVDELQALLELAHRLGAERVGILRLYPLGRAKRCWPEVALSLDEQMRAIRALRPPAGLGIMQSWHPRDHNCCWQSATVDAFGNSIGCVYLREYVNYGNIKSATFLDTWHKDPLYRKLRSGEVERPCQDCSASQGTDGGCRSTAYAFYGRWDAPDPYCSHMNEGVDLRVLPRRLLEKGRKRPGAPIA
jgi:radical SAM protein with 4Fe4S-binding SPASM domain